MPSGHNAINPDIAQRWFFEAKRVYEELDEQKMQHMTRCKDIRARLPEIYEKAEGSGIPKKALKARLKVWIEDQRIAACEARKEAAVPEDDEDAEVYDQLCDALGDFIDTPLGKAAAGAAGDDDGSDVRPGFLKQKEADRAQADENVVRLKKGITGLPGADAAEV